MSLNKIFLYIFVGMGALSISLAVVALFMLQNQNELVESQEIRYQSYLRADELRQSSDDLTRLARTYSLTGESKYEDMYWSILDIRNGKKPRPEQYERIYWDLVAGGESKPRPDDVTVPLMDLMKELGFSEAEFDKLAEAAANSDALVQQETIAMNAVKGLYDDGYGNFTVKGEPNLDMAAELTHSNFYHVEKAKIMKPIDKFFGLLDERTSAEVDDHTTTSNFLMAILIILSVIITILGIVGYFVVRRRVTIPVNIVSERVEQLQSVCITNLGNGLTAMAKGDLSAEVSKATKHLNMESNDEIGVMANSIDEMITKAHGGIDAYEEVRNKISDLGDETIELIEEATNGNLEKRGNADKFEGAYNEIVQGINDTLDAVIKPVQESSKVLEIMATGDLTVRVTSDFKGDHKLIKNSVNSLGDSVGGLIKQLTEAVEATASASTQISSSAEEMAAGAQEQSSQTTEVAAAMEEMSRTIVETASNATAAAEASKESSIQASGGVSKVDESKKGMENIVESAQVTGKIISSLANRTDQIGEIAQVIDDIADQTNLLALNAAIEAARAGEQGRGFAVVADEVRKLAERTTKATKEIAETIKAIQVEAKEANDSMKEAGEAVNSGLQLNDEVGEVLSTILAGAENVASQISQVAAASEEQSATAEQVSTNVEAINNVANESAAGVQQIASASEDLNRLTENLSGLVAQFKVDSGNQNQAHSIGHSGKLLT